VAALKERPDTQHIPVILLTARAGDEARVEGLVSPSNSFAVDTNLTGGNRPQAQMSKKISCVYFQRSSHNAEAS